MKNSIRDKVLSAYGDTSDFLSLRELVPGGDKKNEMVMFLKPEVFLNKTDAQIKRVLDMVFDKLAEYEMVVDGAALMPGSVLATHGIMDRHYGFINVMSREASERVDPTARQEVLVKLGLDREADYPILGGHELIARQNLAAGELDLLWSEQPSTKVKSGFYARKFELGGKDYILVNGFHPQQLAHYTNPDRRILVMLVKSDTDWDVLRDKMVGSTFPEQAILGSIRRTAYENAHDMGFESVTIANNVVHLSAGPTEALYEIDNFFKPTVGLDISAQKPILVHRLMDEGMPLEDVLEILENPLIELSDIKGDLHGLMEHKNLEEAVELWRRYKLRKSQK